MALVRRFEDLHAWRQSRELVKLAYAATRNPRFTRDWSLRDQLLRAAISVSCNIAEGFTSGSHAEFQRFLRYAYRSAAEVQNCSYLALDQGYLNEAGQQRLFAQADRVMSLASALIRRIRARRVAPRRRIVSEQAPSYACRMPIRQHANTPTRQHARS